MVPTFIISLDCEGKWGVADHLDDRTRHLFTNDRLTETYCRLVSAFDHYEVPATFAFVAGFCLTVEQVRAHAAWFEPVIYQSRDWLEPFRTDLSAGEIDGWLCPGALRAVTASGAHEIASHGFCHVPLGESDVTSNVFMAELARARAAEALLGIASDTFVYPRNRVGHASLLPEYGFKAYRPLIASDRAKGPLAKATRFLNEFNPFESLTEHSAPGDPVLLPPGRFLVHRTRARRWVPSVAVAAKFEIMLDRAIARGRTVHLFSHPHNFITGARQFKILDVVLRAVAKRVRAGELRVMTQSAYSDSVTGGRSRSRSSAEHVQMEEAAV